MRLGCRFLVTKPRAVVLSVMIGVGGWMWPISSRSILAGMACLEFKNNAPISASAAEDMTFLMICAMLWKAPLFGGHFELSDMKKCPPALLLAFGSVRYDASLWTFSIMLLALNVSMASGWV